MFFVVCIFENALSYFDNFCSCLLYNLEFEFLKYIKGVWNRTLIFKSGAQSIRTRNLWIKVLQISQLIYFVWYGEWNVTFIYTLHRSIYLYVPLTASCMYHMYTWVLPIIFCFNNPDVFCLRREAVVKIFLPPFGCDLVRPPYVVIDSNLFSMTLSFYFREML